MPSGYHSSESGNANEEMEEKQLPKRYSHLFSMFLAIVALVSFVFIVVYAYKQGVHEGNEGAVPILRVEGPSKIPPKTPGGMPVPHQDKLVYNVISDEQGGEAVERLLPPSPPTKKLMPNKAGEENSVRAPNSDTAKPKVGVVKGNQVIKPKTFVQKPEENEKKESEKATVEILPKPNSALKRSYLVQIASMSNAKAANVEWERRLKQHKDLLGDLQLVIGRVKILGKGTFYRVQAGPLGSREVATELCSKLKRRKVGCLIVVQ